MLSDDLIAPLCGTLAAFSAASQRATAMLRHIVMWRFKEGIDRDAAFLAIKSELEALVGQVPGLRRLQIGRDLGLDARPCDVVLDADFDDAAALNAYQDHPLHLACKATVVASCTDRQAIDFLSAD